MTRTRGRIIHEIDQSNRMLFMGIDPGANGAASVMSPSGASIAMQNFKMGPNNTEHDIADWFRKIADNVKMCLIEKSQASPQMGKVSAFNYGQNYGFLRGILTVLEIPHETISPKVWQKHMQCASGSASGFGKGSKTNMTKNRARSLFPGQKITNANCDALLIAEFSRRKFQGIAF